MTIVDVDYLSKYGRTFFINFTIITVLVFTFLRVISSKILFNTILKSDIYNRKVLIVGGDKTGIKVFKSISRDKIYDIRIVGFLDDYKEKGIKIYRDFYNLGKLEDIDEIIKTYNVDEIIIAIDNMPYERLIELVDRCSTACKIIRIYSNFLDVVAKKIDVEYYANIPVVMLSQYPIYDFTWIIKQIIDKIMALVLIILLFPLGFVISVGIKFSSKGPVIYKQTRIGKNGKPFSFYKFRSMHQNQDDKEHKEFVKNVWFKKGRKHDSEDIKIFRMTNDPRVFRFGKFIRKTSLDEIPQLYNVLKNDMSLVGPRPCMPFEWEMYEEWHKNRLSVLPGCTGLWQALGRATVSFEEMVILDLYYISNMTLWFDLKIIFKTIPVILFGKGGY